MCDLDNGCPTTYNAYESFRSHAYKKQRILFSSNTNNLSKLVTMKKVWPLILV